MNRPKSPTRKESNRDRLLPEYLLPTPNDLHLYPTQKVARKSHLRRLRCSGNMTPMHPLLPSHAKDPRIDQRLRLDHQRSKKLTPQSLPIGTRGLQPSRMRIETHPIIQTTTRELSLSLL
jgi:hypothetical protein